MWVDRRIALTCSTEFYDYLFCVVHPRLSMSHTDIENVLPSLGGLSFLSTFPFSVSVSFPACTLLCLFLVVFVFLYSFLFLFIFSFLACSTPAAAAARAAADAAHAADYDEPHDSCGACMRGMGRHRNSCTKAGKGGGGAGGG